MKKIPLATLFVFVLIFMSFSSYKAPPVSPQSHELKKPPHTWIGLYHDSSTGNTVYICITDVDNTTNIAARLNGCCDPPDASATGTYSNQSVTDFQTTIGGHTYQYTGPIIIL